MAYKMHFLRNAILVSLLYSGFISSTIQTQYTKISCMPMSPDYIDIKPVLIKCRFFLFGFVFYMNKEVLLLKLINKIDEQREKEISIFDYTMLLMFFFSKIY